ncbi:MAG TPA: transposase, partial [Bacillota bacterium]|nr:transposase [Bacillota bacterium]
AKEMALEMLRGNDKEKYLKMLPELKRYIDDNNLVEFVEAYNTLINWHEEILNMFDYPYSNGAMERINRSIKQIKNICYGVKSLPRTLKLVQYRVN